MVAMTFFSEWSSPQDGKEIFTRYLQVDEVNEKNHVHIQAFGGGNSATVRLNEKEIRQLRNFLSQQLRKLTPSKNK